MPDGAFGALRLVKEVAHEGGHTWSEDFARVALLLNLLFRRKKNRKYQAIFCLAVVSVCERLSVKITTS